MYITDETINGWIQFLSNRDYSDSTKQNYKSDLKMFLNWLKLQNNLTIGDIIPSEKIRLIESGMNIREIQELLGHSDIKTTEGYVHILKSNLHQKVSQIFS